MSNKSTLTDDVVSDEASLKRRLSRFLKGAIISNIISITLFMMTLIIFLPCYLLPAPAPTTDYYVRCFSTDAGAIRGPYTEEWEIRRRYTGGGDTRRGYTDKWEIINPYTKEEDIRRGYMYKLGIITYTEAESGEIIPYSDNWEIRVPYSKYYKKIGNKENYLWPINVPNSEKIFYTKGEMDYDIINGVRITTFKIASDSDSDSDDRGLIWLIWIIPIVLSIISYAIEFNLTKNCLTKDCLEAREMQEVLKTTKSERVQEEDYREYLDE